MPTDIVQMDRERVEKDSKPVYSRYKKSVAGDIHSYVFAHSTLGYSVKSAQRQIPFLP